MDLASFVATLRERLRLLRREPERGSHVTEYAIGIGASAAVVLALYAAFRTGLAGIVSRWFFG